MRVFRLAERRDIFRGSLHRDYSHSPSLAFVIHGRSQNCPSCRLEIYIVLPDQTEPNRLSAVYEVMLSAPDKPCSSAARGNQDFINNKDYL